MSRRRKVSRTAASRDSERGGLERRCRDDVEELTRAAGCAVRWPRHRRDRPAGRRVSRRRTAGRPGSSRRTRRHAARARPGRHQATAGGWRCHRLSGLPRARSTPRGRPRARPPGPQRHQAQSRRGCREADLAGRVDPVPVGERHRGHRCQRGQHQQRDQPGVAGRGAVISGTSRPAATAAVAACNMAGVATGAAERGQRSQRAAGGRSMTSVEPIPGLLGVGGAEARASWPRQAAQPSRCASREAACTGSGPAT